MNTGTYYQINGVDLTMQPTTGRWIPRQSLGIDGNGHAIYPGVREFEMTFILESPADYNQVWTYYNACGNTGTVVVSLPQFGAATYTFYDYTGCVLREPEINQYFSTYHTQATLLITNIKTA